MLVRLRALHDWSFSKIQLVIGDKLIAANSKVNIPLTFICLLLFEHVLAR